MVDHLFGHFVKYLVWEKQLGLCTKRVWAGLLTSYEGGWSLSPILNSLQVLPLLILFGWLCNAWSLDGVQITPNSFVFMVFPCFLTTGSTYSVVFLGGWVGGGNLQPLAIRLFSLLSCLKYIHLFPIKKRKKEIYSLELSNKEILKIPQFPFSELVSKLFLRGND